MMIRDLGYEVSIATDGMEALKLLREDPTIDLLFTDVVMPEGMSGHKLAETARRLRPGLKVLFTTGYAAELSDYAGQYVLYKPYDRRDLARAVRGVLDGLAVTA